MSVESERASKFVDLTKLYAGYGMTLLRLNGKVPRQGRWQQTSYDPPATVAGQWSEWGKRWNVGAHLGHSRPPLAVVEPDTEEAYATMLELYGGKLPATWIVQSGGKSIHVYHLDQGQGNAERGGLELRAGNQQCVLPPSIHPDTGRPYLWIPGCAPWDVELAPLPTQLVDYFAAANGDRNRAAPVADEIRHPGRHRALLSLAGSMRHRGMTEVEILAALRAVNEERCRPPLPDEEVRGLAADVAKRYQPAPADEDQERLEQEADRLFAGDGSRARAEDAADGVDGEEPPRKRGKAHALFLPFTDVHVVGPVRWVWRGKIPESGVSLLAGRPKLGKSLLSIWLAAQLSRGLLEGAHFDKPARTLLIAAEDPVDSIVKARLIAAAADELFVGTLASRPSRPSKNSWGVERGSDGQEHQEPRSRPQEKPDGLDGLDGHGAFARRIVVPDEYELLEEIVVENAIALVVLDPINSFLSHRVDAHRDAEIRRVLDPLASLCARRHFAALAVVHLNRRTDTDVLNRITGSGGYGGSARSILTFGKHPENDQQRVVAAEGNWQREARSELFELREVIVFPDADPDEQTHPVLVHVGTTELDSADLVDQLNDDRSQLEQAKDLLFSELAFGAVPVADLRKAAEANAISWPTIERAKKLMGVQARRISTPGGQRGSGRWEWYLELDDQAEQGEEL